MGLYISCGVGVRDKRYVFADELCFAGRIYAVSVLYAAVPDNDACGVLYLREGLRDTDIYAVCDAANSSCGIYFF